MKTAPIIIIKRRGKHHAGHHGGAWKVAYADFVTAMMALFMVLWLLSASEEVQKAVGGYFSDPTGANKDVGNGMRGSGSESLSVGRNEIAQLKEKMQQAIQASGSAPKLKDHVTMAISGEGLRIELSEGTQNSFFFESANANPTVSGKELISLLAAEIKTMRNKVIIEGHTDAVEFGTGQGYSNWELSADRANAARRVMQEAGIPGSQISQVRGFADQKLRNEKDPKDPCNRRITLIVQSDPLGTPAAEAVKPAAAEAVKPGAAAAVKPGAAEGTKL